MERVISKVDNVCVSFRLALGKQVGPELSTKQTARIAQLVERKPFKLVAVGSSPTSGTSSHMYSSQHIVLFGILSFDTDSSVLEDARRWPPRVNCLFRVGGSFLFSSLFSASRRQALQSESRLCNRTVAHRLNEHYVVNEKTGVHRMSPACRMGSMR